MMKETIGMPSWKQFHHGISGWCVSWHLCMLSCNWGLSHRMWETEPKALTVFNTQWLLLSSTFNFLFPVTGISVWQYYLTGNKIVPWGLVKPQKEMVTPNDMENRAYHCHKDSKWKGDKHLFFKPLRRCTPLI